MKLPRVYPIVDVTSLKRHGIGAEAFARQLIEGGAEILQLRDKIGSPAEILQQAQIITEALAGANCLTVMNDRVDLALLAGWPAVHLGHQDLPPVAAARVFGDRRLIMGVSTHMDEQVFAADQGPADYIAIGPVFPTGTKADAEAIVGLEGVRRARALTRKPLVAIGGITRDTAASVLAAGADSVAVIGALFADGEPVAAVLQDFLRRLR